ncbi:MAG: phosphate signaling complex protein PhoU [Lachnospiraceae bacterium]|nr:phosphate signaling complex protein PhoU [Lachnospiraceae bacterium]
MTARAGFQHEIAALNEELATMGTMIEEAIERCFQAMEQEDKDGAQEIIRGDRRINDMEKAIEAHCLSLMLKQQPVVAGDLRIVSTALKVVTDMERIGDHAADIAELVLRMDSARIYEEIKAIPQMAEAAKNMVHDAVHAFINCDVEAAKQNMKKDDVVDELFNRVKEEIVKQLKSDTGHIDGCIDAIMVAKYLERIGDHAVNICEWTEFHETGELNHIRLV